MASSMQALLFGGIGLVVGAFLPWAKMHSLYGPIDMAGTEGDGIITGAAGLLLLLIALVKREGLSKMGALICILISLATFIVGGNAAINVSETVSDIGSPATIGIGLFITVPAAFVCLVGLGMVFGQKFEDPIEALPQTEATEEVGE